VSIYDYITPSEQATTLGLLVNRVRQNTSTDEIPVLIVEGATDESVFKPHRATERSAVFVAGTRKLVEQLLRHLRNRPVDGCECVFLVDCDGVGKTANLAGETALVVTEFCDMEADLVGIGVAWRVARQFLSTDEQADDLVRRAKDLAMSLSVVRRAAHSASIGMKKDEMQLRLRDLPPQDLGEMESRAPSPADALDAVADRLDWSEQQKEIVAARLAAVPMDFGKVCLGKDALDAIHFLLRRDGSGDARGWSCDHFHRMVRSELRLTDFANWEVGRRLYTWQHDAGCVLIPNP
jgi:hypothetical protein